MTADGDAAGAPGEYTAKDVGRLLRLDPALVRSFARAGLGEVRRGPRGELRFDFRDLVLLRAARDLVCADVPARRVRDVLRKLRRQMPAGEPASGVRITAEDGRIVARLAGRAWDPDSGQARFEFEEGPRTAPLRRIVPEDDDPPPVFEADEWCELGLRLEPFAPEEAREAYRRCLELRPRHVGGHVRLGRILQAEGEFAAALEHHRLALEAHPGDAELHFHLGVSFEGMGRFSDAMDAWRETVRLDPAHAEAYLAMAIAADRLGDKRASLRYLEAYHRLT